MSVDRGTFVDRVRLHARGGDGGSGVTSFFRQPYEPKGPPDGGDGGNGGSVVIRASHDVATLVDYHHRPHRKAARGRHGEGDQRRGADGEDEVLLVPLGTVVTADDGTLLGDLLGDGQEVVAARGGRGGRGNAAFKTRNRRAPRFHEIGEPGQERWLTLELQLVADVALVGFPNVGKSSLIARLSAARPKIADYPFTTLTPNLGVVRTDTVDFVVADVPGLIEGASEGRGLGHEFLRHVRRAGVLVHVLDCASYEMRDPREDLRTVVAELQAYQPDLLDRPAVVVLNKVDADADTAEIVRPDLEGAGWEVLSTSAVTGEGIDALRYRLAALVELARSQREAADTGLEGRPVLRPADAMAADTFRVERTAEGFRVRGENVERWVVMTDLSNDEAVRYLQDRMVRAGVEAALSDAGARRGDAVEIAGAVFDFAPDRAEPPEDLVEVTETPPAGEAPDREPGA
jgi:GTPase